MLASQLTPPLTSAHPHLSSLTFSSSAGGPQLHSGLNLGPEQHTVSSIFWAPGPPLLALELPASPFTWSTCSFSLGGVPLASSEGSGLGSTFMSYLLRLRTSQRVLYLSSGQTCDRGSIPCRYSEKEALTSLVCRSLWEHQAHQPAYMAKLLDKTDTEFVFLLMVQ